MPPADARRRSRAGMAGSKAPPLARPAARAAGRMCFRQPTPIPSSFKAGAHLLIALWKAW